MLSLNVTFIEDISVALVVSGNGTLTFDVGASIEVVSKGDVSTPVLEVSGTGDVDIGVVADDVDDAAETTTVVETFAEVDIEVLSSSLSGVTVVNISAALVTDSVSFCVSTVVLLNMPDAVVALVVTNGVCVASLPDEAETDMGVDITLVDMLTPACSVKLVVSMVVVEESLVAAGSDVGWVFVVTLETCSDVACGIVVVFTASVLCETSVVVLVKFLSSVGETEVTKELIVPGKDTVVTEESRPGEVDTVVAVTPSDVSTDI